jgi:hypothetical protein
MIVAARGNEDLDPKESTMRMSWLVVFLAGCVFLCGCIDELSDSGDSEVAFAANDPNPPADSAGQDSGTSAAGETASPGDPGPIDLGGVSWLHTNVSGWSQTATLRYVSIRGSSITLQYDKANSWPAVNHAGATVNANPWIFVNRGGRWYGATWEWMRKGQVTKAVSSVHGSHIKKAPLNNFVPKSGETYGFMVSGLARDKTRNVRERSNVVMLRWP